MTAPTRELRIDLDALRSNVTSLRSALAPSQLMVVVKADAYGHGAIPVARAAVEAGADWLGVADVAEALALRAAGIRTPLLAWLHGPGTDFVPAIDAGVTLGVSSLSQLEEVAAAAGRSARVDAGIHLKVDTGLGRNGVGPDEAEAVFRRAAELERIGVLHVGGIFSHLSNTSPAEDAAQLVAFEDLVERARVAGLDPQLRHLAASAAAISAPPTRLELVRVGLAVYGLQPDPRVDVTPLGLRPVMRLSAAVSSVKRVPAGTGVSYGFTYRTERPTTLALIPLGYADGVPRAASGAGPVAIGGRRYTVAGRIAMDQFVVDVGDDPVALGDRAVLWGDPRAGEPGAEDWAEAAGTINYEIVTRVGGRVTRVTTP